MQVAIRINCYRFITICQCKSSFRFVIRGQDTALAAIVDAMGQTQSSFLPSYWASHGVLAAADEAYGDSVYHFLLLLSNALMATWLAAELAEGPADAAALVRQADYLAARATDAEDRAGELIGMAEDVAEAARTLRTRADAARLALRTVPEHLAR